MAVGQKFIPLKGINTDLAPQFVEAERARYIKNLYYSLSDEAEGGSANGSEEGLMKPLEGNVLYSPITLPKGENRLNGYYSSRETSELYCAVWNSNNVHTLYRINGKSATVDVIYVGSELELINEPEYFLHEGAWDLKTVQLTDPTNNQQITRTFLFLTNGNNRQKFICVEDAIATDWFDENKFPYLQGNYDRRLLISVGQPHFMSCMGIQEIPFNQLIDGGKNNQLLLHGIQFRITYIDVWGRPSEHSIISDLYVPTYQNCSGNSVNLPRRLNLSFDAGIPTIDKIQVEYSFDNSTQWYLDTIISKYDGSNIGAWYNRQLNTIPTKGWTYDQVNNEITYVFSGDKSDEPISTTETQRLFNPLPITSQVGTSLGKTDALSNNTYGFTPIDEATLNEIDFTVESLGTVASSIQLRNVTVYFKLWQQFLGTQSCIYNTNPNDLSKGYYCFGTNATIGMKSFKQNFATDQQRGFLGYLAGTNNAVYSEQGYFDNNGNFVVFTDDDYKNPTVNIFSKDVFQRCVFTGVIPSIYSFRLASHLSDTSVDYEKTSTYVKGLFSFSVVGGTPSFTQSLSVLDDNSAYKEVILDVINVDFDNIKDAVLGSTTRMIVINDLWQADDSAGNAVANFGYIYESSQNKVPVESIKLTNQFIQTIGYCDFTDYNGFYYLSAKRRILTTYLAFDIIVNGAISNFVIVNPPNNNSQIYLPNFTEQDGYLEVVIPNYTKLTVGTISNVEGNLYACGTTNGVSGIPIFMSNLRPSFTDSNGHYQIRVHLNASGYHNTSTWANYFISSTNNEYYTDCNGIIFKYPNLNSIAVYNSGNFWKLTYLLDNAYLTCFKIKTLLTGGRYSVGIAKNDWMDRQGNVNTLDKWFLNVPTISSTQNLQQYGIKVNIPSSVRFTPEVDRVSIYVSAELNNAEYITWIADQVDFVDNSGNINLNEPTQIRIWYLSLNQYNRQNNFNTTTGWQIISTSSTNPRTTDTVEFEFNGDGTYFGNKRLVARIKYDSTGSYFLIDYTPDFANLKSGAFMRLVHPQTNLGTITYYEQCHTIKVINGVPQENSFFLPFFDTYLIQRSIPVSTNVISGTPPTTSTTYSLRTFGFPFEHNSPTDLWGKGIKNIGRVNVANPYENVIIRPNEIAMSGVLSDNGQLNYLCYYDDALKTTLNLPEQSGIVYLKQKTGIVAGVTQYSNFTVGFNDNLLRVDGNGNVISPSAANAFGTPNNKVNGDYGCQLYDKNTIREREGYIHWLDSSRAAFIQHNFQNAKDVSRYNEANSTIVSWLTKKINSVQVWNSNNPQNKRYFTSVINPQNFEYLLTDNYLNNSIYVNKERDYNVDVPETLAFDIFAKAWKAMYSPTPEYWGYLEGEKSAQNQLFSFKNALPYRHYFANNETVIYNNFFGEQCERVYKFICSIDGFAKKRFLTLSIYCPQSLYWSDEITTESGQLSYLFKGNFIRAEYASFAPFLRDVKTLTNPNNDKQQNTNPLIEGNPLYGTWVQVRLIGDLDANANYSEFFGATVEFYKTEKTG